MVTVPVGVGAEGSVATSVGASVAGASVTAGGAVSAGGCVAGAAPPQAVRIMLVRTTNDIKIYRLRFTVSPPERIS